MRVLLNFKTQFRNSLLPDLKDHKREEANIPLDRKLFAEVGIDQCFRDNSYHSRSKGFNREIPS